MEDVVPALLDLFEFKQMYVADIDALQGAPPQWRALDAARRAARGTQLWIDAGLRDGADAAPVAALGTVVLASETLSAPGLWRLLAQLAQAVLSIDRRNGQLLGDPQLLQAPERWPADVIALDLAHVGSGLGPDLQTLQALRLLAPRARVYVGGGLHDAAQLRACRTAGAAGVLVASALHDGRIGRADLEAMQPRP